MEYMPLLLGLLTPKMIASLLTVLIIMGKEIVRESFEKEFEANRNLILPAILPQFWCSDGKVITRD